MKTERTNILIMGVGRSGSQAVFDLLSEYDNIGLFPGEFDDFRAPGMVADQLDEVLSQFYPNLIDFKLGVLKGKSKLVYKLLPQHIQENKWMYSHLKNYKSIDRRIKHILYRHSLISLNHVLKSDVDIQRKIFAANQWIKQVGRIYCQNDDAKNFLLMDQPVTWPTNPDIWTQVFDPFKMIVSIRNPKDQLANLVRDRYIYHIYGAPYMNWGGVALEAVFGRTKKDALNVFIRMIGNFYKKIDEFARILGKKRFMLINFEDFVTNHDNAKASVESFLGKFDGNHIHPNKHFDPAKSVKNIGIHDSHLDLDEIELLNDLEKKWTELKMNWA